MIELYLGLILLVFFASAVSFFLVLTTSFKYEITGKIELSRWKVVVLTLGFPVTIIAVAIFFLGDLIDKIDAKFKVSEWLNTVVFRYPKDK